jgi:hypothetical protein
MKAIYARQGDLVVEKLAAPIDGELVRSERVVFAGDSSGHRHSLSGAVLYRRDGGTSLVRVSKAVTIEHERAGGHRSVPLTPGDYSIRTLRERGGSGDRSVED